MNYAYVTLLSSEDYLPAAIILHKNLQQVNSKYPLLVAVTENIADVVKPYLQKENILYKIIPFMEYSAETKKKWLADNNPHYTLNIASKFALFKFYDYDKLVYLDLDILIYKNIDELFNYPDGALYDDNGSPFIGLFVFCPKNHKVDYYYTLSLVYNVIESMILEPLFFPFHSNPDYRIPTPYYFNFTWENFDYFNLNDLSVVHFCYKYKPWKYENADAFMKDYTKEFVASHRNRYQALNDYYNNYCNDVMIQYPEFKQYWK
jgi:alpha-N-acetylglucosamine transferase